MVVLRKSPDEKIIPMTSVKNGKGLTVLNDLYQFTIQIVNIHCVSHKENFILVNTGMPKMSKSLVNAIERHFGSGFQPQAIVLTHGHFDHVDSIIELLKKVGYTRLCALFRGAVFNWGKSISDTRCICRRWSIS